MPAPWPWKAALAISSDCEFLTRDGLLGLHRKLSGPDGLGLEVAQSLFFYTTHAICHSSISWFSGAGFTESADAGLMRELIAAGHADTIHAWGDFDAGGWTRAHGEAALDALDRHGLRLPIYSNHGSAANTQNLGHTELTTYQHGDDPAHESYTLDQLRRAGVRYAWVDNALTTRLGGPEPLLYPATARDGTELTIFRRFRGLVGKAAPNAGNLPEQFTPDDVDALSDMRACAVVYQHFGVARKNPDNSFDANTEPYFAPEGWALIEHLAARHHDGTVLSAATGRLLRFVEVQQAARALPTATGLAVTVDLDNLTPACLGGLAFELDRPPQGPITVSDRTGNTVPALWRTEQLGGGRQVVHVPWTRLEPFAW